MSLISEQLRMMPKLNVGDSMILQKCTPEYARRYADLQKVKVTVEVVLLTSLFLTPSPSTEKAIRVTKTA
jgi:hypothetical protein